MTTSPATPITVPCSRCQGTGEVIARSRHVGSGAINDDYDTCPTCHGSGTITPPATEQRTITQEHAHMLLEVVQGTAEFLDSLGATIGRNPAAALDAEALLTALSRVYVALEVAAGDAQGDTRQATLARIEAKNARERKA